LWLELPVGNSRRVRWAGQLACACGVLGGMASVHGLVVAGTPSASGWLAGLILTIALLALTLTRALRRLGLMAPLHGAIGTHLCVDSLGSAFLRPVAGLAIPLEIRHVHRALGVLWVDALADGHRYRLLSGVDLAGDTEWNKVAAWVTWLRRGPRS
jgi:hypothetical protein